MAFLHFHVRWEGSSFIFPPRASWALRIFFPPPPPPRLVADGVHVVGPGHVGAETLRRLVGHLHPALQDGHREPERRPSQKTKTPGMEMASTRNHFEEVQDQNRWVQKWWTQKTRLQEFRRRNSAALSGFLDRPLLTFVYPGVAHVAPDSESTERWGVKQ